MGGKGSSIFQTVSIYDMSPSTITRDSTSVSLSTARFVQIYGTNGGPISKHAVLFGGIGGTSNPDEISVFTRADPATILTDENMTVSPSRVNGVSISWLYQVR